MVRSSAERVGHPPGHRRDRVRAAPERAAAADLVGRYAQELRRIGFGSKTQIWLDEVSSFTVDFSKRHYSRQTQAMGADKLLHTLPGAGGASVPGEPVVTRIYYMRFAGAPHDALVVRSQREPIYFTFANRDK